MLDNKIILIGYSGHGFVLVDIAIQNNCNIVGYTEKSPVNKNPFELIYLGNENDESFKLWDKNFDYLIENHLNCIRYTKPISKEELIILYKKIIISFDSEKTNEFIKLYFGNNAMNTTELCEILPIYDI